MLAVFGQCYEIRERLKALGCMWNPEEQRWFAPEAAHAEAQSLADAENRREWLAYLDELPWGRGTLSQSCYEGGLRAASLRIGFEEAVTEIHARRQSAGGKKSERNTRREVSRAYAFVGDNGSPTWKPNTAPAQKPKKPVFQNAMLTGIAGAMVGDVDLGWLADCSPVCPFGIEPGDFLSSLYSDAERVVVFDHFESQGQWIWAEDGGFLPTTVLPASLYEKRAKPFEQQGRGFDGRGPKGIWFLCNPVDGDWRWMTDSGDEPHWSRRYHECVTSWRYLVLESDKASARDWVAMAVQIPLRIAAIYTSGGKSVHVLVRVDARSKREWDEWRDELRPMLVPLGADPGAMSAVRLTRLPGCYRDGAPQKLLYLNPTPDMTPICVRPRLRDAIGPWVSRARELASSDALEVEPDEYATLLRALDFYEAIPEARELRKELCGG